MQRLGLADEMQLGTWAVHADAEKTLRALGERGDILRATQRAMRGEPRELGAPARLVAQDGGARSHQCVVALSQQGDEWVQRHKG
ncbi:putative protein DUf3363 [Aromatoleum bremense]|uniref:Uncharacterized protein n=1 Tax=Stutzerimonas stutzeri KOS6 TaxID=1218352 RepID=A0A061JUN4_STUST|nr:hypothetical protein B597_006980 [Stutzerimonas stutzeri KOS6]QTQ31599.1 putative protein DUf3363 [Aromatoleum bremense]